MSPINLLKVIKGSIKAKLNSSSSFLVGVKIRKEGRYSKIR